MWLPGQAIEMSDKQLTFGPLTYPCYFLNDGDEEKYPDLDYRLKFILTIYVFFLKANGIYTLTFTDFDTPGVHSTSCHYDRRAVDVRLPGGRLELAEAIAECLNQNLLFGGGHVCALVGRFDPSGKHDNHIHFQVPAPYRNRGNISLA